MRTCERQSLWLDLKILAATALVPLRLEWLIDLERERTLLVSQSGAPGRQLAGQEPAGVNAPPWRLFGKLSGAET